jgi:hypothetical protein
LATNLHILIAGLTLPSEYVKNELMDYFYFALIILGLVAVIFLLNRYEKGIKVRYKKTAYSLLESDSPDVKKIRETIKGLRIYGGRWFKDKECVELVSRLQDKYDSLEKLG